MRVALGFARSDMLAYEITQYRVDQSGVLRFSQETRCFHRHGDCRVIGHARITELEQADEQQRFDDAVALLPVSYTHLTLPTKA